jgi:GNAT superfamily N-acetyltransferase
MERVGLAGQGNGRALMSRIVEAAVEDAQAIRDFMAQVIVSSVAGTPEVHRETIANVNRNLGIWLEQPERCVHLKAVDDDGALLGVILVKDSWNLCSLFVDPALHRRGIGRALVEAAAGRCRGRGPHQQLMLNAATNAVSFYERLGFVPRVTKQALPPGFVAMQRPL